MYFKKSLLYGLFLLLHPVQFIVLLFHALQDEVKHPKIKNIIKNLKEEKGYFYAFTNASDDGTPL